MRLIRPSPVGTYPKYKGSGDVNSAVNFVWHPRVVDGIATAFRAVQSGPAGVTNKRPAACTALAGGDPLSLGRSGFKGGVRSA